MGEECLSSGSHPIIASAVSVVLAVAAGKRHSSPMKFIGTVLLAMAWAQAAPSPPPPPDVYHPNPGPFVVFVRDSGELEDHTTSTLKNAVESWSPDRDKRLGAFLLCLRKPTASRLMTRTQDKALSLAAEALMAAGASVVTVGTDSICSSIPRVALPVTMSQRTTVEVRGVLMPRVRISPEARHSMR